MGRLLIIKTGITYDSVIKKYGDCDRLITQQAGIPYEEALVVPVYKNIIPSLEPDISSIIITGSDAMVSDRRSWSVATEKWLRSVAHKGIPILGICYGHQLLAQALGGTVDYHPDGKEYGEVDIALNREGEKDPLLGVLPSKFSGYAVHSQTIIKLPPKARVLANNTFEASHAVRFSEKVWGVQFHPEFNGEITKIHIEEEREELAKEGYDVEALYNGIHSNDYGKILLERFISLSDQG